MTFTLNQQTFPLSDTYQSAASALSPLDPRRVLGIRLGGETLPLTAAPHPGDVAETLDYTCEEGRRIYERSLRFVFLLAIRRRFPHARVRLEHSMGRGVYAVIHADTPMTAALVESLEQEM